MQKKDRERLMVCNRCHHTFNIGDAAVKYKEYCGINIIDKVCPECGGTFRSVQPPGDLEKYLYVNDDTRYYEYQDKGVN